MNCELFLTEHLFPALLAQSKPSMPPEQTLRSMLVMVARQMAAARGLDQRLLPDPGQWAPPDWQGIDFAQVDVTLLGNVYTSLLSGRRRRGSYYTPPALAESIARRVIAPEVPVQRVLDPSMGSGHFLLAAASLIAGQIEQHDQRQARWSAVSCLYGVDNDPAAVELAAVSLWLWAACPGTSPSMLMGRLVCADTLLDDHIWQGELASPFDAVIGNPPYASAITRARSPHPTYRSALQSRYHSARGSFDLSVPFVERAVTLCREGGRCGLVLPNKLLAADYARTLRSWLGERVTVEAIFDASQQRPFVASVYPVALILRNTPPPAGDEVSIFQGKQTGLELARRAAQADLHATPGQSWSCVLAPDWEALHRCWQHATPLGDVASLASGLAVGEAYALRPAVFDAPDGDLPENTFRLLTSGLIRRFECAWGHTPAAYLRTTYLRPAISANALPARRRRQAAACKIIVAGMGKTPRALVDYGQSQASVSTTIITDAAWPLDALCAILNSQLMGRICQATFGGLALGGGHMRFGKPELARLPLPPVAANDPRLSQLDALAKQRASTTTTGLTQTVDEKIEALVFALYSQ